MLLGKIDVSRATPVLSKIRQAAPNLYNLPRFYCGPFNLNLGVEQLGVVVDTSWVKPLEAEALTLLNTVRPEHTDVRERVVCYGGQGNANKAFRMLNYLDCGIRLHIALTEGAGVFQGTRSIEYEQGSVFAFTPNDTDQVWTNLYKQVTMQLVFVVLNKKDSHKSNWRMFAEHNRKVSQ